MSFVKRAGDIFENNLIGGNLISEYDTYADDAAAGSGGLVSGEKYITATGELRIKL